MKKHLAATTGAFLLCKSTFVGMPAAKATIQPPEIIHTYKDFTPEVTTYVNRLARLFSG